MSEAVKIRHVMKGIEDDAFQMLLAKTPQAVAEVTTHCLCYGEPTNRVESLSVWAGAGVHSSWPRRTEMPLPSFYDGTSIASFQPLSWRL